MKPREKKITPLLKKMLLFFAHDYDLPAIVGETGVAYRTLERRVERLRDLLGARHPQGLVIKALKRGVLLLEEI